MEKITHVGWVKMILNSQFQGTSFGINRRQAHLLLQLSSRCLPAPHHREATLHSTKYTFLLYMHQVIRFAFDRVWFYQSIFRLCFWAVSPRTGLEVVLARLASQWLQEPKHHTILECDAAVIHLTTLRRSG